MKKRTLLIAAILSAAMLFSACGTSSQSNMPENIKTEAKGGPDQSEKPDMNKSSEKNSFGPNKETASTESSEETTSEAPSESGEGGGMNGADMTSSIAEVKKADTELQEMISTVADKFEQDSYTDEDTGLTVPYNIYLPEDYDSSKEYPMVVFIGDMSTAGTDMEYPLTQGWGGLIWATDEIQDIAECIVLVPVYPETILDDHGEYTTTEYVDITPNMITSVAEKYNADTSKIYGTGQSMGAMTTLLLAAKNPDLYAAILIVDGQWDISELKGLESQNMIYVVAGGDENAYNGQNEVKEMLDEDGISYSEVSGLDAQADRDELNSTVQEILDEGNSINFITWEAGTVLEGVSEGITSEHMASFDYGYKLTSVLKWILSK